jgi:hypothetical protein
MHFDFPMKVPDYASAIDSTHANACARTRLTHEGQPRGDGFVVLASCFPRDAFLRVVGPI